MKILITGGNGYIGKSLFLEFHQRYDTTSIGRSDADLTDSIAVSNFFEDRYYDVIIHCAVEGGSRLSTDSVDVLDANLKMYYNLLSQRNHYGKFINMGSGAERCSPETPYGKSKSTISYSISDKELFFNIIIYAVFDENELSTRFIKSNITRYINNEPMLIDGNKKMTFFYMPDLIMLVEHIMITDKGKLMNKNYASYINEYSLLEIANMINSLDEKKVKIYVSTEAGSDYVAGYNAGYLLPYKGFIFGLNEVYNKLK